MEFQLLRLPAVPERSIAGSITVLKSPPIMIFVVSCNAEQKVSKKDGSSLLGLYRLRMFDHEWMQ